MTNFADDVDLRRLVAVWPELSAEIKAALLAVAGVAGIQANGGQR